MFATRKNQAERTASQAWEHLSAAVTATGRRSRPLADRASGAADEAWRRAELAADEAWRRAELAADALAGRRPGRPWALIAGAGLLGLAAGWAAATTARAALERQAENERLELAESTVVVTPTYGES
ncbi:hypothetical protein [Actinoplanes sp. NPDC051851]|uniref:hypothetical protein n=1 Tax=Actinoplanes sp. NPDC051851 TaxID=3154753 RepID=UPI0034264AE0